MNIFTRTPGFDKLIEDATSPLLLESDWGVIMKICDLINQGDVQAKYAFNEIKKCLYKENAHVTFLALEVLDSCVKNCGTPLRSEIATESFMNELYDFVKTTKNAKLKEKILELVHMWAHAFYNRPYYGSIQNAFNLMRRDGCEFPTLKESDAMFDSVLERAEGDRNYPCKVCDKLNRILVKERPTNYSSSVESSAYQSKSSKTSYLNREETTSSRTMYYELGKEAEKINANIVTEVKITRETKHYLPYQSEMTLPRVHGQGQYMIWQHQQHPMMYGWQHQQHPMMYGWQQPTSAYPAPMPALTYLPQSPQYSQMQPLSTPGTVFPSYGPLQMHVSPNVTTSTYQQPYNMLDISGISPNAPQNAIHSTYTPRPFQQYVAQPPYPSDCSAAFDGSGIPARKGNFDIHNTFDAAETLMPYKLTDAHAPTISNTNIYSKVTSPTRGISLLINNYSFTEKRNFSHTSAESSAKLSDVLRKNKYDVTSYINLSAVEMEKKIKEICGSVTDKHDSVIIGISSHGNEISDGKQVIQVVYGTDCKPVNITDIIFKFASKECPQLRGKVKIFLIDACRGTRDCEDISAKKILDQLIKRNGGSICKGGECAENIIIINVTQKGFYSYVGTEDPVLLFACFADCLNIPEYRCMKLGDFFKAVKEAVEKAAIDQIGKKIKPEMQSDLDDDLEFSFGNPKKLTPEERSSAITKASMRIILSFGIVNKSATKMKHFPKNYTEENQLSVPLPKGYMKPKALIRVGNRWFSPAKIEDIEPELIAYRSVKRAKNSSDLSLENGIYEQEVKIRYNITPEDAINKLNKSELLLGSKRVIFIVHGFSNDRNTSWLQSMKNEMLKCEDQTVIIVAWGGGANLWFHEYGKAAQNIQPVGNWLANYAREIKKFHTEIWGIGHSLGAHLLGIAGRKSKAFTRITGLDPAGPSFEDGDNRNMRLQKDDAQIVDVIHTDGHDDSFSVSRGDKNDDLEKKGFWLNHCGTLIPLGTADFYPNYGFLQPGCKNNESNHRRAIELFIWSIFNPGKFVTNLVLNGEPYLDKPVKEHREVPYPSVEMGYHYEAATKESLQEPQNYYLETSDKEPWI